MGLETSLVHQKPRSSTLSCLEVKINSMQGKIAKHQWKAYIKEKTGFGVHDGGKASVYHIITSFCCIHRISYFSIYSFLRFNWLLVFISPISGFSNNWVTL